MCTSYIHLLFTSFIYAILRSEEERMTMGEDGRNQLSFAQHAASSPLTLVFMIAIAAGLHYGVDLMGKYPSIASLQPIAVVAAWILIAADFFVFCSLTIFFCYSFALRLHLAATTRRHNYRMEAAQQKHAEKMSALRHEKEERDVRSGTFDARSLQANLSERTMQQRELSAA